MEFFDDPFEYKPMEIIDTEEAKRRSKHMYGDDCYVITDEMIDALKHGKTLYGDNDEYCQIIRYKRTCNEKHRYMPDDWYEKESK